MAKLTPEAEQLIRDSIAIVREDRFEKFVKERWPKVSDPKDPDPKDPDPNAPPKKDPDPNDPPKEPRKSAYWGILEDE